MSYQPSRLFFAALLFAVAACGSANPGARPATRARGMLYSEEMLKAGYPDVFTTVQSLRPEWLRRRGASARESIKVYLDGQLLGGTDQLRQITTRSIATVQYLDGLTASERWGLDHGMGAILVSTRQSPN